MEAKSIIFLVLYSIWHFFFINSQGQAYTRWIIAETTIYEEKSHKVQSNLEAIWTINNNSQLDMLARKCFQP